MASRLTMRQEKFCLFIVKGEVQSKAYELAGYSSSSRNVMEANASRLLQNANIESRIAELQRQHAIAAQVTVEMLSEKLLNIHDKALEWKQAGAAKECIVALARLHGLEIRKTELEVTYNRPSPLPTKLLELSVDEWQSRFKPDVKRQEVHLDEGTPSSEETASQVQAVAPFVKPNER